MCQPLFQALRIKEYIKKKKNTLKKPKSLNSQKWKVTWMAKQEKKELKSDAKILNKHEDDIDETMDRRNSHIRRITGFLLGRAMV